MPLTKEAMSKEDFDRAEKELLPIKREKVVLPDPKKPITDKEIFLSDVTALEEFYSVELVSASRKMIKNEDGITFIGFDVSIEFLPKDENEKSEDIPKMDGWMVEGEFLAFVRTYRKKINQNVINW